MPALATLQATDAPDAAAYLRQIERSFERHGLAARRHALPERSQEALNALLDSLGADESVSGILVTLPLPKPLSLESAVEHLPASKDVEGIHPWNAGVLAQGRSAVVPSTPLAGLEILKANEIELRGKTAVIIGRSPIVGRPLRELLLAEDATVVTCHSRTPDLGYWGQQADVLLVAAGRAGLVNGPMVKPGATVVDFGINEVDGKLVGDVDFASAAEVAGAITPVPGGVGPVTASVLARNLLDLAERHRL